MMTILAEILCEKWLFISSTQEVKTVPVEKRPKLYTKVTKQTNENFWKLLTAPQLHARSPGKLTTDTGLGLSFIAQAPPLKPGRPNNKVSIKG